MKHWVYWKELCDEFLKVLCTEWAPPRFVEEVFQWYGHGHPHSQNPSDIIWASTSHITLAIWIKVRFRVTGDAHITRLFEMGMPKRRGCTYHCERGLFVSQARESRQESARGAWYFFGYFRVVFVILSGSFCGGKSVVLIAVTRMEMNYNFKKLGQLFRHKCLKVPWYEPFKSIIFLLENNLVSSDVSTPTFCNYAKFNLLGILYWRLGFSMGVSESTGDVLGHSRV